jgi:hypothetical protein
VGDGWQPKHKAYPALALFHIGCIIFATFFFINLFVGEVVSSYNKQKDAIGNNKLLTNEQKDWIETKMKFVQFKPIKKFKVP